MRENIANKPLSVNISMKLVAAVILFVLIAVAFYFFVASPKIDQIKALNDQISKAEEKLNLLLLAQERLSSLEREINLYNDRLVELKKLLPPQSDEFLFAEEFVAIAKKANGQITSLNFEKDTKNANPAFATFTLNYEGPTYESVTTFLRLLKDNYPQIISFSQVVISKPTSTQQGVTPKYVVTIKGNINLSQRK